MNTKSRTLNTAINAGISLTTQLIILLLSFMSRTVFIRQLGVEYLGVSSLYTNILNVLSLAELGIGTAMAFILYHPIANKNYGKITSLINYFKRVYKILALVILIIGLIILPFLGYIVNVEIDIKKLQIYYLLFLINNVVSYLVVHKTTLLQADQRLYIIKFYKFFFEAIKSILQILVLIYFQSFVGYLLIQMTTTLINNIYISKKVDRLYPFLRDPTYSLDVAEKKSIYSHVKAMFLYKLGGVLLNSTDNIIISLILGTIWVGYYSNYYLVVGAIITIGELFFGSFAGSVGNLNISKGEKSEAIFKLINFMNFWMYGLFSVLVIILIDDFISLWLGKEFVLDSPTVVAITLNLYIPGMLQGVTTFRNTTKLFVKTKYVFFVTAILNLALSIILGINFGLFGILIATVIARVLTNFWYEPFMLYKLIFKKSSKGFFIKQVFYAFVTTITIIILDLFFHKYFINISLFNLIMKAFLSFVTINVIFYMINIKNPELIDLRKKIFNFVSRYIMRRNNDTK